MPIVTLLADVTFTDAGLAIIGALLAAMAATVRMLWTTDLQRRDEQIRDITRQRDLLLKVIVDCHLQHRLEMHGVPDASPEPPAPQARPPAGGTGQTR